MTSTKKSSAAAPPAPAAAPAAPRFRTNVVRVAFGGVLAFVFVAGRAPDVLQRGSGPARGFAMEEVAHAIGVRFEHRPAMLDARLQHIAQQVSGTGAAVSICDPNGDGWPDLYATSSADGAPNGLFINQGDGTFRDMAEPAGLAAQNRAGEGASQGSVWADYDADGRQDVFVYKWGRSQLFRNAGELRFEDATAAAGVGEWMNASAATWLDFDRDGRLDLVVCTYYADEHDLWNVTTTRVLHNSFEFATNGGRNRLYRNLGDGRFEEMGEDVLPDARRWTYAAVAADFDRDGWIDLYFANDYGAEELMQNRGGRFERAEGLGLDRESKSGMCVALGNVMNDGRLAVFVTNISRAGYLFQGNNLRLSSVDRGGGMPEVASGAVADCGWAWGAQFGDLNDDGWQDLVVVNGFISQSRERDYWYQMSKLAGGSGDLVADAANWPAIEDRSLSGYERTRVLLHAERPGLAFTDVAGEVGVLDEYDGRAAALADLDRDGDLDLVVANQNGPLLVYRNTRASGRHWLGIDLVGARGNTEALGAEVTVEFAGGTLVQIATAASGFAAQNDRRLHFGLGEEPGRVRVRVRWPSGREQVLEDLELDRAHVITEGES